MRKQVTTNNNAGFTLLEVLAALAIAAIGLAALAKTLTGSVHLTTASNSRIFAYWVASNHASELQVAQSVPSNGNDQAEMANQPWFIQREVIPTRDEDIFKIIISVRAETNDSPTLAKLTTYMARFKPSPATNN